MSSIAALEDGEIQEQHNHFSNKNDILEEANFNFDGKRGSTVLVSMTMEQREEVRSITETTNIQRDVRGGALGAAVTDESGAIDLSSACVAGTSRANRTTVLMSRTRTRKVTTKSSSVRKGPLNIGIEVVFGEKRAKLSTEDPKLPQGNAVGPKKQRRISKPKKTSEVKLKDLVIQNKQISILDIESNEDNEIDEDEMMFVRGASPPLKTKLSSTPEILTYLCSPDKPSKNCKSNAKGKTNYMRRLPSNKRVNKRNSKKQLKINRQKKVSVSSNLDNQKVLTLSPFSISSDGQEKTFELCKFFLENECFRGIDCEYMHEEFPCKYYYLGLKCEEIDIEGNKTCKLFHGGPLGSNLQNALRRHLISAPTDVLGQTFCDNVLSQKTRDELVSMMEAFQIKLEENNKNCKPAAKLIQNEKSDESLKILRQKLCFLTEQQIESLQNFNVQRPEDAINLTLCQLNSIGINKGIHLEAILATVLNGQDVDMRKLLPQPQCEKALAEIVDDGDEEDEDKPLIIDETKTEENEETCTSKDIDQGSIADTSELSSILIEEAKLLYNATDETRQKIQDIKNSKASAEERKKDLFEVLNKLNELEHTTHVIKNTCKSPQAKKLKQIKMKNKNINLEPQKKMKVCETASKQESTKNSDDIVFNNEIEDQSKKEKNDKADKSFLKVETALEQLHNLNSKCETSNVKDIKYDEIKSKDAQKPVAEQFQPRKQVIIKLEKLYETNHKASTKISTDDGDKMTLRSQRKSITPSPVKFSPSIEKKPLATKIILSDIKVRRLKIPKKTKIQIISNEILNESEPKQLKYTTYASVNQEICASEDNIKVTNVQPNVQAHTSQYTDDWEDCIEQTRMKSHRPAFDIVKTENLSPTKNPFKCALPSRDSAPSMTDEKTKFNLKKPTVFQQRIENVESNNDLRQKIDEKKKCIERNHTPSPKNKNPFSNKSEELPKSYNNTNTCTGPFNRVNKCEEQLPKSYNNTNAAPFNRVNKGSRQPCNYDSEEDWDKDEEQNINNLHNNSSTNTMNENYDKNSSSESFSKDNKDPDFDNSYNYSNKNINNNNYKNNSSCDSFSKDDKEEVFENSYNNSSNNKNYKNCTVAGVPDSPIDEDIKINSSSSCNGKVKRRFSFEMKVNESNYYDVGDTVASPTLSPVVDEIASPTYPSISSLSDYTPAMEIDGHMSFPAMPYCLHEIKMANIEVNKPETLDKLLRSNTVDPRLLKYKEKGYLDSPATPALSYFSSHQMSQYDPRRRTAAGIHASPFAMDTHVQKQNPNMLLYRYLQQSPWYQGLMSTMKMQINHSIAELVRSLNSFQKERLIDPSAIFDVFKLDCAGELLEIMRNIGIFIDANGFVTEDKSFGIYGGAARPSFNSPAPITSTYSFMPQLLPQATHTKPGIIGYATHHGPAGVPVAMGPQVAEASFVSCYVEAPTFSQLTQRRQNTFPIAANTPPTPSPQRRQNTYPIARNPPSTPPPPPADDDEECWDLQDDSPPQQRPTNDNPTTHCNNKNNRNIQMNDGTGYAAVGSGNGRPGAGGPGAGGKRNDRTLMRYDNRRNGGGGGSFNYGYRF